MSNFFSKVISGTTRPVATTLSAQKLSGATSFTVQAATGWDTGTYVHGIMYRTDSSNNKVPGSQIDWKGAVSGTTVSNVTITAGTDDTYEVGTTVELSPTAAWGDDMATGMLVEHNQDGTHSDVTAETLAVSGATTLTGALTMKSYDGYIYPTYTPVYVSATSIKVTGSDVTAQFPVGTKVKFSQTTTKYFYVTAATFSTDTTITLTGGSDYTVANAAISNFSYSYMETPQGFPDWLNYTPTFGGTGGSPALGNGTIAARFQMRGKLVNGYCTITTGSTTVFASTQTTITAPVTASTSMPQRAPVGGLEVLDASPAASYTGAIFMNSTTAIALNVFGSAGTYTGYSSITSTVPVTPANGDLTRFWFSYEAA